MKEFIIKDGKRLALGYTTGSCAAAAAKAACWMLLTGKRKEQISLMTPKGIPLELEVREIDMAEDAVSCAIEKDSGDDPDITRGALIFAKVEPAEGEDVLIEGGVGVGRVTKPGLDQSVGNAAINSVPRRMITENVREVMALMDYHGGIRVTVSVPDGERLAARTFNPRLGIVGGISILGTTGIVEPMSESALVETIRVELRSKRAAGQDYVLLTPGNYGSDFIRDGMGIDPDCAVQVSNFVGDALDYCRELGFKGALLIGHIGKIVKIGGGMLNTHSKYGDCRMEILAAMAGAEGVESGVIAQMLECVSCDEAIRLLDETGKREQVMARLMRRVGFHLQYRAGENPELGCATFSKVYGMLGMTDNAKTLLQSIREE